MSARATAGSSCWVVVRCLMRGECSASASRNSAAARLACEVFNCGRAGISRRVPRTLASTQRRMVLKAPSPVALTRERGSGKKMVRRDGIEPSTY